MLLNMNGTFTDRPLFSPSNSDVSAASDTATIFDEAGRPVTSVENGKEYYMVTLIDPNAPYNLDTTGALEVRMSLANVEIKEQPRSSSGGCNAGLPLMAGVLALSGLLFIKRK